MARIVNEAAYAARRNAILDAALRAIGTKGYEQMAIADLLSEPRSKVEARIYRGLKKLRTCLAPAL